MSKTELKKFVADYLATKVRKDARIELMEYKSGITVCVRIPHVGITGCAEWSLPAIITVYCIQSTNAITARLDRYLGLYNYMLAA